MVTDAMIEAGATAFCETLSLDPRKLAEVVYTAMHEARPTADLGEDGELIARLRSHGSWADLMVAADEAADRLILYREALERIGAFEAKGSGANYYFESVWELVDVARDVLSRSA